MSKFLSLNRIGIRVKLVGGFMVLVILAALVAAGGIWGIKTNAVYLTDANAHEHDIAMVWQLRATAKGMIQNELDMVIKNNIDSLSKFNDNYTQAMDLIGQVELATSSEEESMALADYKKSLQSFNDITVNQLSPAIQAGDQTKIRQSVDQLANMVTPWVGLGETLISSFQKSVNAAKASAEQSSAMVINIVLGVAALAVLLGLLIGITIASNII
jgi:hypothetical protein